MRASLALLMLVWSSSALTAPIDPTAGAVLAANRAAVGPLPATGTLELDYTLDASGLTGPASEVSDLATGAYVDRSRNEVISEARGYDGRTPWQTDVSGVSTD